MKKNPPDQTDHGEARAESIRRAYAAGGMSAAVKEACGLALDDLRDSQDRYEAVEAAVMARLEQGDPQLKRDRMDEQLAVLGLGKRRSLVRAQEKPNVLEMIAEMRRRSN